MFRRARSRLLFPLLLLGAIFAACAGRACSVPVFRYALEHWPADPYQAFIFHRGPLTAEQEALAHDLSTDGLAGQLHANLWPKTVNLGADPPPELLELARAAGAGDVPWLVVRTPRSAKTGATILSGPLTAEAVHQLLESPARKEIVERLSLGQTAVWLLLESGDREKDTAAAQLLDARLADLTSRLTLPKLDPSDIVNGLVSVGQEDLRLEFSTLRIARDDAAEQPFIRTLLGTEADLKDAHEPIAIPVFGRGRALYAFVGAGIKHETIDQAASFLISKCSCQVKELNPGADLLLAADWDGLLKSHASAMPDLPTLAELSKSAPVTVTMTAAETKLPRETNGASTPARYRKLYLVSGAVVALLVAGMLLLRKAS